MGVNMLLSEAIEALALATKTNGRSAATVTDYRRKLSYLLDFLGDIPIENITVHDLRRYVSDLMDRPARYTAHHTCAPKAGGLSPFYVAGLVRAMKRLFNWLVEEGELTASPARRIKTPAPRRIIPKGISNDDLLALFKTTEKNRVVDIRDRAIMFFLADTGCRVGGICSLTQARVNLDARLATITEKGEKTRMACFTEYTARALRAWLEIRPDVETGAFFLGMGRWEPITPRAVSHMLMRRGRTAGIKGPVNPHSFRHAFARDFLLDGGDLGALADLMGHSSVLVTKDFYGIFTMQELQEKHAEHSPVMQIFGGNDGHN